MGPTFDVYSALATQLTSQNSFLPNSGCPGEQSWGEVLPVAVSSNSSLKRYPCAYLRARLEGL